MAPRSPLLQGLWLAVAYYLAARLALLLAIPPGYATAVWPAAGVALAGILVFGYRVWPGILLGAFCLDYPTALQASGADTLPKAVALAAAMAGGASLQAVTGAWLIRRFSRYPVAFSRELEIGKFLALGGAVACLVNASIGVTLLWLSGGMSTDDVPFAWLTWWAGDTIGVLVFMPLFLVWVAPPDRLSRRQKLFISVPVGILLAAVTWLFVQASALEQHRIRVEYERRADAVAQSLVLRLASYTEVVHEVGNFVASSRQLDNRQFQAFTADALRRYPGLHALSWNPLVEDADRAAFESANRQAGQPALRIVEMGARGDLVPASRRPDYVPVTYIEPLPLNRSALGFDVASEPSRRAALQQARRSAAPAATGVVDLVQESPGRSGVIIYQPVYWLHEGDAAAQAPALHGYVAAVFLIDAMMAPFLQREDMQGMHLRLYDTAAPVARRVMYRSDVPAPPGTGDRPGIAVRTETIVVAGRRWQLTFFLSPEDLATNRSWLAWCMLAVGMLFAALSSIFLLMAVGRRVAVESEVRLRTSELESSNIALQQSREHAQAIIDTAYDAYVAIDANSRILAWNRQAERMFGWHRDDVSGRDITGLVIPPRFRQAQFPGVAHLLANGDGPALNQRMELVALHRDGHEFPIELTIWPTLRGETLEFHAFVHDISAQLMANRRLSAQTAAAAALIESDALGDAGPRLLQAVCEALGWSVGLLWIVDRSDGALHCAEAWHAPGVPMAAFLSQSRAMAFAPGIGLPGRVFLAGRPEWIADVASDDNFPRAAAAMADGLRAAFAVPVNNGAQGLGVVEFFSLAIQEPDPDLLGMMDTLGNLLGQFIARSQAERALEQEGEFLNALLDNITEGIVACDAHGNLTMFNEAARALHGLPGEPMPPQQWSGHYDLYLADGITPMRTAQVPLFRALHGEQVRDVEMVIAPRDLPRHVVVCNGRALVNRDGDKLGAVVAMHDITERKQAEERLQQLAHFDVLTGLPNRHLFQESLKNAMAHADAQGWLVSLLFLDMDNFKDINDSLGHAIGDELLRQAGERLLGCVRLRDTVGRLGGDEFGVILLTPGDPQVAVIVAEKILAAMRVPFVLDGHTVTSTVSIGITVYPTDTADMHSLVRYVDMAMYEAKQSGRNGYRFYTEAMNLRASEKRELQAALGEALERGEFVLHYQPKVSLDSGRWTGMEALLRWRRPGRGLVPPSEFIPALEESGLIVAVGAWVIAEACRQLQSWRASGLDALPIAVNVSAQQMAGETPASPTAPRGLARTDAGARELWSMTAACLQRHEVPAGLLEFELTESALMSDAEYSIDMLRRLQGSGIHISVDDFGTGYSSLAYLRRFPLDAVKIDGSFIRDVTTNAEDASITLTIIDLAHRLNLQVIAECVETAEQLDFLRAHGCDQAQGYFLARPMPADELERLWRACGGVAPGSAS
ncbi:EAL domain-containing protein [Cognatiluteimonas profundi]|uniref:EAL domain-containing protein n=1 Tax=Cognatiluteimonas profundi TaxID=2594501 RepID=UPI00131AAB3C|nr:EAL domain-containing protein [Lysobacter profundi]